VNPVTNPYAPGAGTPPPLLAGRDGVIEAWDVVLGRAVAGNPFQPIVLAGLRGVGKTVLLLAFRQHASEAGWPIELFEARPGGDLRAQIAEALPPMIRSVNRRWRNEERAKKIGRIAASFARAVQARLVAGGFRIELEPEPGYADTGDLETDLTELLVALGEGARDEGLGAALLIDELHEVPPDQLGALIGAAHRVNQERLPVVVGGAGLPPVGRVLSEARSYAERLFSIRPVGALSPDDTRAAFEEPAADLGVAFERRAVDELVELSGGYPFFIQSYGKHVWDVADDSPIAPDDVALARPRANRELVDSFFRPRYDRATPAERRYMHAMADIGDGPVSSAEVAARLGHDQPSRVSPQRDGLLTKGLIYAPDRGQLAFTVPHMEAYLRGLTERP
jgi:AAA ATPase domain